MNAWYIDLLQSPPVSLRTCLTSSTSVTQVREPPDVAQAYSTAYPSQGELDLPAPCRPAWVLVHFQYSLGFLVCVSEATLLREGWFECINETWSYNHCL